MELLELKNKTLELFNIDSVDDLGNALLCSCKNNEVEKFQKFDDLIEHDMSKDYLQMIFQYYMADRKDKKQDYTPACLGKFLSKLIGESIETIDMCAGSGSLTIQRCLDNPDGKMICYEIDGNVIPYLLFNLALRNKTAEVHRSDILQEEIYESYSINKGDKYGKITCIKSAV